ncbi:hypothetical protein RHEC894_CH01763 [Rhizobium sp. CIAT894]|nr:hypothetical protein RHEC894_CH01763 [Rhizobium sp. CIAT894]
MDKKLVSVPWVWKLGAFAAACVAIPLLGRIDWEALVLEHQTLVTGVLTVIAALGMIVQIRVSDHRNDKRPEGFMLRTPTAQTRRRDDEDDY